MYKVLLPLGGALFLAACAGSPPPQIDRGPEAVPSFDGLLPVEHTVFSDAWADEDIDLSRYSKILLAPAVFEFRAVRQSSAVTSRGRSEFWISDDDRQRLEETVTAAFREELSASTRWEMTSSPAADTLTVAGELLDIVSQVPPEAVGRNDVYLASVGAATLVVELRDSLSGETLFRGVDRSAVEASGRDMIRANAVTTWAEVRRWARRWAVRMREGLDTVPRN